MNDLLNKTEQRTVYLGRLAKGILKAKLAPSLNAAYEAARVILLTSEESPSFTSRNKILASIRKAVKDVYGQAWDEATKELEETSIYDAALLAALIGLAIGKEMVPSSDERLIRRIEQSVMTLKAGQRVTSGTWSEFVKHNINSTVEAVASVVTAGYAGGQTPKQIAAHVKQSTGGVLAEAAAALLFTGLLHMANRALEFIFGDNGVDDVVFVATLDNRTTLLCASLDGKRYKITDMKKPVPPLHWRCRSRLLPAEAIDKNDTREALSAGAAEGEYKKENIKYTQYDDWLRKQPHWYQEETLGVEKAQIFREGKLSLGQFVDLAGRPLTLAKLKELDGNA